MFSEMDRLLEKFRRSFNKTELFIETSGYLLAMKRYLVRKDT